MATNYGNLLRTAREFHTPPLSGKQLADILKVKPPFITDIEKGRRLPSLKTQRQIKKVLACEQYPDLLFDDFAAADNDDPRIVAEDLAKALRERPETRDLIRKISEAKLPTAKIKELTATIGGKTNDTE
jgi:transcriptional regulator with XRE-family HTH domain